MNKSTKELCHANEISLVGVDWEIGKDGAFATKTEVIRMPTIKKEIKPAVTVFVRDNKGKKIIIKSGSNKGQYKTKIKTPAKYSIELDCDRIYEILNAQGYNRVLAIELPGNTVGNSARSTGTTFMNYGKILALAEILDYKIVPIAANKWKRAYNLPADKEPTVRLAQLERPNEEYITKRNKLLDGKADATIIYKYYIENYIVNNKGQ